MRSAFSLVELSIVLVILGLLTGGILAGQSLIRAAELRSVNTERQRYQTATATFRDKYFGFPGDLNNATSFWSAEPLANCPGDETTPSTTAATCDGNGDGSITWSGAAGFGGESHRFWQHLANAGLIEGSYSGTHSAGTCNGDGSCNVTLGVNAPASKLGRAGWTITNLPNYAVPNPVFFAGQYGNTLLYGRVANYTTSDALKPEEAWNIDTKTDDGMPAIGAIRTYNNTHHPNCTNNNTSSAAYTLSYNSSACGLNFKLSL